MEKASQCEAFLWRFNDALQTTKKPRLVGSGFFCGQRQKLA
ncbi:hypothetical protein [Delftia acidovorans]